MLIILSLLFLIIIYSLLTPRPIYERLNGNGTGNANNQNGNQGIPSTSNGNGVNDMNTLKNQINILELSVENLKRSFAGTQAQVEANRKEIVKFNNYIEELKKQVKEAEENAGG